MANYSTKINCSIFFKKKYLSAYLNAQIIIQCSDVINDPGPMNSVCNKTIKVSITSQYWQQQPDYSGRTYLSVNVFTISFDPNNRVKLNWVKNLSKKKSTQLFG